MVEVSVVLTGVVVGFAVVLVESFLVSLVELFPDLLLLLQDVTKSTRQNPGKTPARIKFNLLKFIILKF